MTTSELFRRDPPKGKKEFSAHKGYTVIELMVVIAVVAIITSLALPSYRTLIEKRQVTSGAQQIAAFLSSAQLEAVKRNEFVAVHYEFAAPNDWCIGVVAGLLEEAAASASALRHSPDKLRAMGTLGPAFLAHTATSIAPALIYQAGRL